MDGTGDGDSTSGSRTGRLARRRAKVFGFKKSGIDSVGLAPAKNSGSAQIGAELSARRLNEVPRGFDLARTRNTNLLWKKRQYRHCSANQSHKLDLIGIPVFMDVNDD